MSYQEKTGPIMANSHPGSYCGQDAYNDMLITQRERERVWGMTTERNFVLTEGKSPAIRSRDWKDPNVVIMWQGD